MSRDFVLHYKRTREAKETACGRPLNDSWTIYAWRVECKVCGAKMGLSGRPCDILTAPNN